MADSKLPPDLADTEAGTPAASDGADWRDGLRLGDRYVLRRATLRHARRQALVNFADRPPL
jgi:hypothetical protein